MKILNYIKLCAVLLAFCFLLSSCAVLRPATETPPAVESRETTTPVETTEPQESSDVPESTQPETAAVTEPTPNILSAEAVRWVNANAAPQDVIMTLEEIKAENARLLAECPELVDILAIPEVMTGEEVRTIVSERSKPNGRGPWFDRDQSEISGKHVTERMEACATELIPDSITPVRAVTVERGHLRRFPDEKPYYSSSSSKYDTIQHTELRVGMPLWVLHTSRDGCYYFVTAYHYNGWIKAESIALTDNAELWESFASPESFVCVTDKMINVNGADTDMGTVLPLVSAEADTYTVLSPVRADDGTLTTVEAELPKASASEGYLPYTYENYIAQAFKYEGTPYGWGGLDGGVDCSGFISNVMRTFGFELPRDTKHQDGKVGKARAMSGKSHEEVAAYLDTVTEPAAVYYTGHVLFYLGCERAEGKCKYYFIHAPQIGEEVKVTCKESLYGVTSICTFSGNEA